jgi:flagellar protein FliO/FliZ
MAFIDILKMLGPIVLILGLLYGALILVRKYSFPLKGKQANSFKINVLNTQMILPKKYISVIKVEDKMLVLGISENSINLLKEIDYQEEELIEETNQTKPANFLELLRNNFANK